MNSKNNNLPGEKLNSIPWKFYIPPRYSACDQVLIPDTNVLMDMIAGDLLEYMFNLDCIFVVPINHYECELKEPYPYLREMGLQVRMPLVEEKKHADVLIRQYPKIGDIDTHLVALAISINRPLITGDKELKRVAQS